MVYVYTLPEFCSGVEQEKLSDTAAEAERIAADLVRVKQERAQRSDEKDSETIALSTTDVETAKAETRDLASRLQLAEDQVDDAYTLCMTLECIGGYVKTCAVFEGYS